MNESREDRYIKRKHVISLMDLKIKHEFFHQNLFNSRLVFVSFMEL